MYNAAVDFDAIIYGESHPNVVNYLRNQFNNLSPTLTAPAREFMQKGAQLFERAYSSDAMNYARSVLQRVMNSTEVRNDTITGLYNLSALQNAGLVMQRWIMANPVIREMYVSQKCDGYCSTYFDNEPNKIGDDHYDYRRVMDTVMQDHEDGWVIKEYLDELKEGDRDLIFSEKVDILKTWTALELCLSIAQDDPTNKDGGKL